MTQGLRRYYGGQHLHFITASCYRRRPLLATGPRRGVFLRILEEVRRRYGFVVVGYVVMAGGALFRHNSQCGGPTLSCKATSEVAPPLSLPGEPALSAVEGERQSLP